MYINSKLHIVCSKIQENPPSKTTIFIVFDTCFSFRSNFNIYILVFAAWLISYPDHTEKKYIYLTVKFLTTYSTLIFMCRYTSTPASYVTVFLTLTPRLNFLKDLASEELMQLC